MLLQLPFRRYSEDTKHDYRTRNYVRYYHVIIHALGISLIFLMESVGESQNELSNAFPEPKKSTRSIFLALGKHWEVHSLTSFQERRTLIVREILATETSYLSGLSIAIHLFMRPLKTMILERTEKGPFVTMEHVKRVRKVMENSFLQIFSSIDVMHGISVMFLQYLQHRLKNWSDVQIIGDVWNSSTFLTFLLDFS